MTFDATARGRGARWFGETFGQAGDEVEDALRVRMTEGHAVHLIPCALGG
jgi:hypothetical protein